MDIEKTKKYLKSLNPQKKFIDANKKYWGWKNGEFGNPLPKHEFKSGFKPKVAFDPPEGREQSEGFWTSGKWIPFEGAAYIDGEWVIFPAKESETNEY